MSFVSIKCYLYYVVRRNLQRWENMKTHPHWLHKVPSYLSKCSFRTCVRLKCSFDNGEISKLGSYWCFAVAEDVPTTPKDLYLSNAGFNSKQEERFRAVKQKTKKEGNGCLKSVHTPGKISNLISITRRRWRK